MPSKTKANDTAERINAALRRARYGTTNTATYLQPRSYYYQFSAIDDFMALELLVVDQARLQCEKAVKVLSKNKRVFTGRFKQLASRIYKLRTFPLPVCNEIEQAVTRNMSEDDLMAFGVMASHIDDVIQPDMDKLTYTLFNEIGRSGVKEQEAMTALLSCHLFGLIAINIMERCEQMQRGSHYLLCKNPSDADCRDRAYLLSSRDLVRLSGITIQMLNEMCRGEKLTIPYTQPMETSIDIICTKICDVVNIYDACMEAEVNISDHSAKDLESLVKRLKEKKAKSMERQDINDTQPINEQSAAEAFAEKGWKIKTR